MCEVAGGIIAQGMAQLFGHEAGIAGTTTAASPWERRLLDIRSLQFSRPVNLM